MPETPAYKRILLKLSGEALMGEDNYGINRGTIDRIVDEVAEVSRMGVEVAVVIGGGNIFRGVAPAASHMDRATADYMGMLATVMNALAIQDAMRRVDLVSRVQSALNIEQVVDMVVGPRQQLLRVEGRGDHPIRRSPRSAPRPGSTGACAGVSSRGGQGRRPRRRGR